VFLDCITTFGSAFERRGWYRCIGFSLFLPLSLCLSVFPFALNANCNVSLVKHNNFLSLPLGNPPIVSYNVSHPLQWDYRDENVDVRNNILQEMALVKLILRVSIWDSRFHNPIPIHYWLICFMILYLVCFTYYIFHYNCMCISCSRAMHEQSPLYHDPWLCSLDPSSSIRLTLVCIITDTVQRALHRWNRPHPSYSTIDWLNH